VSSYLRILPGNADGCLVAPLQTATTGTTSGSGKDISAPGTYGLVTLTDGAATFNSSIVGKLVFISAAATGGGAGPPAVNLGYFQIYDQPSPTTFRFRNADAQASTGVTYSIVSTIPAGGAYGTFLGFDGFEFTVGSTSDRVYIDLEVRFNHSQYCTSGTAFAIDGLKYAGWDAAARSGAVWLRSQTWMTGLSAGKHWLEPGIHGDYGYFSFSAWTDIHYGNATYMHFTHPQTAFNSPSNAPAASCKVSLLIVPTAL